MKLKAIQYWFHEIKFERSNIKDNPKSGRPHFDDIDAVILKTLIDYPFATLSMISKICDCSIAAVYNHLTDILGYKNYTLRWATYLFQLEPPQLKETFLNE